MSREVRRVPIDFDWPLDKVWEGYLTPERFHEEPCLECYRVDYTGQRQGGSGSTPAAKWLEAALYLVGMMAEDVTRAQAFVGTPHQFTEHGDDRSRLHPYLVTLQRVNVYEHRRPSKDIVDLVQGIVGHNRVSFGIGSDFAYKATEVLRKAAELPENWGTCPGCDGHGSVEKYPGQRAEAEAWHEEDHDPPTGDGWQYWETVSEGSPISPVFATAEELAQWLTKPHMNSGGVSIETARRIVADGWVPSGMITATKGVESGEQAYESGTI